MDEDLKQQILVAVVAFNLTVVIYMIGAGLIWGASLSWGIFFTRLLVSVVLGGVVAAGAFFGMKMAQG